MAVDSVITALYQAKRTVVLVEEHYGALPELAQLVKVLLEVLVLMLDNTGLAVAAALAALEQMELRVLAGMVAPVY